MTRRLVEGNVVLLRNAICEISKFKNCNRRNGMGESKSKKGAFKFTNTTVRDS